MGCQLIPPVLSLVHTSTGACREGHADGLHGSLVHGRAAVAAHARLHDQDDDEEDHRDRQAFHPLLPGFKIRAGRGGGGATLRTGTDPRARPLPAGILRVAFPPPLSIIWSCL